MRSKKIKIEPGGDMNTDRVLLKICVYSDEQSNGITLYERITLKAKELGLAGATVIK